MPKQTAAIPPASGECVALAIAPSADAAKLVTGLPARLALATRVMGVRLVGPDIGAHSSPC